MEARGPTQAPAPPGAAELRATRSIDVKGLRSLDEKLHLSFDVDDRGTLWMYQFGWLQRREESQIFRVEASRTRYSVVAIPEAMQRQPFAVFCVGSGLLYLLGSPAPSTKVPTGFALDAAGRVVSSFHLRVSLLDAVADPSGGIWIAGVLPAAAGQQQLVLQFLNLDDKLERSIPLEDWSASQFSCLARADEGLLLGGTGPEGATRIDLLTPAGRRSLDCPGVGQPLSLGFGPDGGLLCLSSTGRLCHLGGAEATAIRLLDPLGRELRGITAIRFAYKHLYALTAKRDRILEFRL